MIENNFSLQKITYLTNNLLNWCTNTLKLIYHYLKHINTIVLFSSTIQP